MDRITHRDVLALLDAQAELFAMHLSVTLGTQVSKDQVKTAIFSICRADGQPVEEVTPEAVTMAAFAAIAPAIEAETLLRKARDKGIQVGRAITIFSETQSPLEQAYATCAQETLVSEGELEFDYGCAASVSSESGAYVQGWKWVSRSALPAFETIASALLYGFQSLQVSNHKNLNEEFLRRDVILDTSALEAMLRGDVLDDNIVLARFEGTDYARELTVGIARQLIWSHEEQAYLRYTDDARTQHDGQVRFVFGSE